MLKVESRHKNGANYYNEVRQAEELYMEDNSKPFNHHSCWEIYKGWVYLKIHLKKELVLRRCSEMHPQMQLGMNMDLLPFKKKGYKIRLRVKVPYLGLWDETRLEN